MGPQDHGVLEAHAIEERQQRTSLTKRTKDTRTGRAPCLHVPTAAVQLTIFYEIRSQQRQLMPVAHWRQSCNGVGRCVPLNFTAKRRKNIVLQTFQHKSV